MVKISFSTAPVGNVIVTSISPTNSVLFIIASSLISSVITTVGVEVATVFTLTVSVPGVLVLPTGSVIVAVTVKEPSSAGGVNVTRTSPSLIFVAVKVWSVPFMVKISPSTASAGKVIVTSTSPIDSLIFKNPSLFMSSVITTIGALGGVSSKIIVALLEVKLSQVKVSSLIITWYRKPW